MENVIFKYGTRAEFDAVEPKDEHTLYWVTDEKALYKGDALFGTGREATQQAAGLLSAQDKRTLDELAAGEGTGLQAVDGSIIFGSGDKGRTVRVGISEDADNAVTLREDGLYAEKPQYALEKKTEGAEEYAAVYRLKCTLNGQDTYLGDEINIPKDMVVKSATLETVKVEDEPYKGAKVGDPYIEIVFSDEKASHIYVPMKGIVVTSNFVTSVLESDKGKAVIANDITGGGAWFKGSNGLEGFVGVNDGAPANDRPTPSVQLYAAAREGSTIKDGSFINVYQDRITYNNRKRMAAGAKNGDATSEIAVLADITASEDRARALYNAEKYEFVGLLPGCRTDVIGREIRVMFPQDAVFTKPTGTAEGRDDNTYYFGVRFFAPGDEVTGFKEDNKEIIEDHTVYTFDTGTAGVDEYGRKYDICWFPAARYEEASGWKYFGRDSVPGKSVGWYHTIEWLDAAGKAVGSETVRINLTNEDCHNSLKQYLGMDNTPAGAIVWEEM